LIFFPKYIFLVLALDQLFHASSTLRTKGHGLYGWFNHLWRPSWFILFPFLFRFWCIVGQNLFFLFIRILPFLLSLPLTHCFTCFFVLNFYLALHALFKITLRNHYRHIK
jgi:hypothetical protein